MRLTEKAGWIQPIAFCKYNAHGMGYFHIMPTIL